MSTPVAALVKYNPCSVYARRGVACPYFIGGVRRQCGQPLGFCDAPEYDGWLKDVIQGKTKCFYPLRIRLLEIPGMILMVYHVQKKAVIGEAQIVRATCEDNRHYYWFERFLLYPNPVSLRLLRTNPKLGGPGRWVVRYISKETVDEIRELSELEGESKERIKRELEMEKAEAERHKTLPSAMPSYFPGLEDKRLIKQGVESEVLEKTREIYLQARLKKLTRGKPSKYMFYSSLYLAFRLFGIPKSLKEIRDMGKLELKPLASAVRSLMENLEIKLPQAKTEELIIHYSKELEAPQEIVQSAINFARNMEKVKVVSARAGLLNKWLKMVISLFLLF
jgi:hypothetical protein